MIKVTWKHEGSVEGVPVGPLRVIDIEARAKDPVMQGKPGMPYGYKPEWVEDLGWVDYDEAERQAAARGVSLEVV